MALGTVANYNGGNFQCRACFGWIADSHQEHNKRNDGTVQYLCAPRNDRGHHGDQVELTGKTYPLPVEVNPKVESYTSLTKDECDFWIDLLQRAGFKFYIDHHEVIGNIPFYLFRVEMKDHFCYWGPTLGTLTALRYIHEYANIVLNAIQLSKEHPNQPAWDILMVAIRTKDTGTGFVVHDGASGHSLVYNFPDSYPHNYGEVINTFLMRQVTEDYGWGIHSSFNGTGRLASPYNVDQIKTFGEGKVNV